MAFCGKCGSQIGDDNVFCPKCGALQEKLSDSSSGNVQQPAQQNVNSPVDNQPPIQQTNSYQQYNQQNNQYGSYNSQPYQTPQPVDTTGLMVWSVLTTLLCCMPLGIAGIVFCSQAKKAVSLEEAQNKLKNAKLMCIIGDVVGFLTLIAYIFFMVLEEM